VNIQLPIQNDPVIQAVFDDPARFKVLTKGRRVGVTRSKANDWQAKCLQSPKKYLWVDTVHRNIDRYVERFFIPPLKVLDKHIKNKWSWNAQKKVLKIFDSIIDFGSAERPENLEGEGYDEIFLNEAGIILYKGRGLWEESLRPMLADRGGSALIAGVPKGIRDNYFFNLSERCGQIDGWKKWGFTSYDSPYTPRAEIKQMESEMPPQIARQEIYGEFVDAAETENPWLTNFEDHHISEDAVFNPRRSVIISFDFNIDPMLVTFHHVYKGGWHTFDEESMFNATVPAMIERIKKRFPPDVLARIEITGDATSSKRDINRIDHKSSWDLIVKGLKVNKKRIRVPKSNPPVKYNRELCNHILYSHPGVKVNPKCKTLIYEARYTEADAEGGIPKKNRNKLEQRADALDTWRYVANAYLRDYIKNPGRYR
jgi:hypothetical protein